MALWLPSPAIREARHGHGHYPRCARGAPSGDFEVWVWSPDGATGDFVLGFGVEEDFSNGFGGLFEDWSIYAY